MAKIAWITGAGKGLGRHVALLLAGRGWRVAATARTEADLDSLVADSGDRAGEIVAFPGDITGRAAMLALVTEIEKCCGHIDLAILNAGTYIRFGVDDFSAEKFADQININVIGTVNCLAPVLESMKARRVGQIAVVSSLSGYRGLPLASAYGASKAALTNMCEALKPELETSNISLSIVHPGFVRTPLTDKNEFPMPFLMEPDVAARRLLDGLEKKKFEITFPTRFALMLKLMRCLPYTLYFRITRRILAT